MMKMVGEGIAATDAYLLGPEDIRDIRSFLAQTVGRRSLCRSSQQQAEARRVDDPGGAARVAEFVTGSRRRGEAFANEGVPALRSALAGGG